MRNPFSLAEELFLSPLPLRVELLKILSRKFSLFSFKKRLEIEALYRPHLAYGMFNAAIQAKGLGIDEISVLEFGIYCGKALFFMEKHAKEITSITGVKFKIYGFDILNGLPSPMDYRDQEYFWPKGAFKNNETKMRRNIKESILVLGDVKNTASSFIEEYNPPTIGFISFDLDYYSSTIAAFDIFESHESNFLPRVECYMDDIASYHELSACKETGVLKAIEDFNSKSDPNKKILKKELVSMFRRYPQPWNEKFYVYHNFMHKKYNTNLESIKNI